MKKMLKFFALMMMVFVLMLYTTGCESLQNKPSPTEIKIECPELDLEFPIPPVLGEVENEDGSFSTIVQNIDGVTYVLVPMQDMQDWLWYIIEIEHLRQRYYAWLQLLEDQNEETK